VSDNTDTPAKTFALVKATCDTQQKREGGLGIDTDVTLLRLCCRVCFGPQERHSQSRVQECDCSNACDPTVVRTQCFRGRRNHGQTMHQWYVMLLRAKKTTLSEVLHSFLKCMNVSLSK